MYGLIHVILKDLVLAKFGQEAWDSILAELGLQDDAGILELKQYDDSITVAGVTATSKVLGISFDDALRAFGAHFVAYIASGGRLRMLERMGDDLKDFMRNLNKMHYYLEREMRQASFPCFHISDEEEWSFKLSYKSVRGRALAALVEGILPAVASVLHGQTVRMKVQEEPLEGYAVTWQLYATCPSEMIATRSLESAKGKVSDAAGAARWGFLWHHIAVSCCSASTQIETEILPYESESPRRRKQKLEELGLDAGLDSMTIRDELDTLALEVKRSTDPADVLMRAVPCHRACSRWEDLDGLRRVEQFWNTNTGDIRHFDWTFQADSATRFVSHSWAEPSNWHEVMGDKCSYAEMKGTELQLTVMEIAELERLDLADITFWIDKCCIPQKHSLMNVAISLIEEFLDRCEGMIVLLTWQYFERLWCVYEWASFLVHHPFANMTVCLDAFLRPSTLHLYLESIKNLTVDKCKCANESDRSVLKQKVAQYYKSERLFEAFVRCSAIALIAHALCKGASRGREHWEKEYLPFASLAKELRFDELAESLLCAEPERWRSEAMRGAGLIGSEADPKLTGWQPEFHGYIDDWFATKVIPVVLAVKAAAVRPTLFDLSTKHSTIRPTPSMSTHPSQSRWSRSTTT